MNHSTSTLITIKNVNHFLFEYVSFDETIASNILREKAITNLRAITITLLSILIVLTLSLNLMIIITILIRYKNLFN